MAEQEVLHQEDARVDLFERLCTGLALCKMTDTASVNRGTQILEGLGYTIEQLSTLTYDDIAVIEELYFQYQEANLHISENRT